MANNDKHWGAILRILARYLLGCAIAGGIVIAMATNIECDPVITNANE